MAGLPLRPGGEVRSPARLGRDNADHLVNVLRRQVGRGDDEQRPVHRTGIIAEGRFEASGALAGLTRTEALSLGTTKAVVRFSSFRNEDWAWRPDIRGMACRLTNDQGELDLVAMTAPRFLVRREEDFINFPGSLPGKLVFAVTRRTTLTALWTVFRFRKSLGPVSHGTRHLADETYFGVHTFWLEKANSFRAMRYHWRPVGRAVQKKTNLDQGLLEGLEVSFDLVVDLFDPDPPVRRLHDPLRRWPTLEREWWPISKMPQWRGMTRVIAGRLTLTKLADKKHPATGWVFNPVPALGGFEASDDEILQARGSAYVASHVRRQSWP